MGNFFNDIGQDGDNEAVLMEIRHLDWKRSIIFQGIEFRQNEEEKDPPLTMLFVLVTFGFMQKVYHCSGVIVANPSVIIDEPTSSVLIKFT
ncbi:hypothetical protein KY290_021151 [Solanum tuberosum]|uniref:Uncharacterized protein n=1 Tax=Solanum tuberosum TaxID=4113 RepID=A0ABQ7V2R6_SOLTU|nr:hypothetical protein KY289_020331 [Solanum tuberosum]KAH0692986.1 hypothetical protein KY285_020083 [Solanum tuberosum]KAH0757658.1 hypothetical protein KY290_021151 [Solanum tuberosum]